MKDNHTAAFYIITGLIVVLSFFLLVPKLASRIFAVKRKIEIDNFISAIVRQRKIAGQQFWQWREFVCPGVISFNRDGLTVNQPLVNASNIQFFSYYSCEHLNSYDGLVSHQNRISSLIDINRLKKTHTLVQTDDLIVAQDKDSYLIFFILPNHQMKHSIGFFDYQEKDKQLTSERLWINVTEIKL